MPDSDFQSTVAYLRPSHRAAVPAIEQLRALQEQALRDGRSKDAAEYARMMNLMADQLKPAGASLFKKIVFAVFFALVLVLAIHYFVA